MSTNWESKSLKKSSGDCLKLAKHVIQHLSEMMLFLNYYIFSGSAEALVRCGGKLEHQLIAYFLGNTCAKHYENRTMLYRVTAKNVGDVFFETHCISMIRRGSLKHFSFCSDKILRNMPNKTVIFTPPNTL